MSDQGGSSKRRFLRTAPLLLALLALAWALGSLPKSQPGGSWLLNSYWLLYLLALFPVFILGIMLVLLAVMMYYWRDVSDAIGMGMSRYRKQTKRGNQIFRIIVFIATWSLAAVVYATRKSVANSSNSTETIKQQIVNDPSGPPSTFSALTGAASTVSSFIRSDWFYVALLGLIVVSAAIMVRSYKVSVEIEKQSGTLIESPITTRGIIAVQDAIKIVQDSVTLGPRERIVACYERMIRAASEMGANVTPDMTARELERSIRRTFMLKGDGIKQLTGLFEEARYSLHPMTEGDSETAHSSLVSIEEELRIGA